MSLPNKQGPRRCLTQQSGVLTFQPRVTRADTNERDSWVTGQNNRPSISNGETPVDSSRSVVGWLGEQQHWLYTSSPHTWMHRVVLFTRRLLSLRRSHPRFDNQIQHFEAKSVLCNLDISLSIWKLNVHVWISLEEVFNNVLQQYSNTEPMQPCKITQTLTHCVCVLIWHVISRLKKSVRLHYQVTKYLK